MPRLFRTVLLVLVVGLVLVPSSASSQDNDDRRDADRTQESPQQPQREIAAAAGRAVEAKGAFVDALRRLVEGLPGTFGDEGPRLRAAVTDMSAALARWDSAIGQYRLALGVAGDSAEAHVALGTVYFDRGQMPDAIDQFRRATDLAPRWGEAFLLLGFACDAQGKRDESARALEQATRVAPERPAIGYARVQQAVAAAVEGEITRTLLAFRDRYDGASRPQGSSTAPFIRLGLLRETAGAAPVFAPALYAQAFRLLNSRRYGEAIVALRAALDRDPVAAGGGDLEERVLAARQLRDGQLAEAIARLEQAIAKWPEATETRRLLATAYASDERYARGVEQLTVALERSPRDERVRLALAETLLADGQPDLAERALKDAIQALPESSQASYRLGRLYQTQSRVPAAIEAFRIASEGTVLVGRDSLYATIAALHVGEGAFADAIAAYRRELDANPNNAAAHRRLGDLYAQDGRLGESLAELAAALLIDPADADTHASRAQVLLRMSRFADAEASARKAVVLSPTHEAARYALGTALMRTGRTEEGLAALREFERLQTATRARTDAAWQVKLLKEQALERAGKQDYRAAADLLGRAIAYAPDDGSVRLAAGALLTKAGQYVEAIQVLKGALDHNALDAHRYLAESYAALGRDAESQKHQSAYDAVKAARSRQGVTVP
jgi:predicted Zn-dependent protease